MNKLAELSKLCESLTNNSSELDKVGSIIENNPEKFLDAINLPLSLTDNLSASVEYDEEGYPFIQINLSDDWEGKLAEVIGKDRVKNSKSHEISYYLLKVLGHSDNSTHLTYNVTKLFKSIQRLNKLKLNITDSYYDLADESGDLVIYINFE